jgi:hypothetical protein
LLDDDSELELDDSELSELFELELELSLELELIDDDDDDDDDSDDLELDDDLEEDPEDCELLEPGVSNIRPRTLNCTDRILK